MVGDLEDVGVEILGHVPEEPLLFRRLGVAGEQNRTSPNCTRATVLARLGR